MSRFEHFIARLGELGLEPKPGANGGYTCRCPAHDDHTPSLTINSGKGGIVLLHCHAGCTLDAILRAIRMEMRDLFEPDSNGKARPWRTARPTAGETGHRFESLLTRARKNLRGGVPEYARPLLAETGANVDVLLRLGGGVLDAYRTARGDLIPARLVLPGFDPLDGTIVGVYCRTLKSTPWRNAQGQDVYKWVLAGSRNSVLGGELLRGRAGVPVVLCAGGTDLLKATEALPEYVAISSLCGESSCPAGLRDAVRDRKVIAAYDADPGGAKGLARMAQHLDGSARELRRLPWPEGWGQSPDQKDLRDFVRAFGPEALRRLVAEAVPLEVSIPTDSEDSEDSEKRRAAAGASFGRDSEGIEDSEEGFRPLRPLESLCVPAFPVNSLPTTLRDFVLALAEASQVPVDVPAMLALTSVAVTCARYVEVEARHGWREPLNLFTVSVLPPANRKSAVFRELIRPLEVFEQREAERLGPEIAKAQSRARIRQSELRNLEAAAAKESALNAREDLRKAAEALAEQQAGERTPSLPRLLASDVTVEKLSLLLHEHDGRMAVMSPEGEVFELMAGRYSNQGQYNFEVFLKGHAGDTLRVDRMNRAPEFVEDPALTVGLTVQPDVLRSISEKPSFRGRGLTARFLFAVPESLVGRRKVNPPPVPEVIRGAYGRLIAHLLERIPDAAATGHGGKLVLTLSEEASLALIEFEARLEPRLGSSGDLGGIADWAGKLVGAALRIAGLLHLARAEGDPTRWSNPIEGSTLRDALSIADYLVPHAQAAHDLMAHDPVKADALAVVRWLRKNGEAEVSARDVHQGNRARFRRVEELEPVLSFLCDSGYLREHPVERSGTPGRPHSPRYDVHPSVFAPERAGSPPAGASAAAREGAPPPPAGKGNGPSQKPQKPQNSDPTEPAEGVGAAQNPQKPQNPTSADDPAARAKGAAERSSSNGDEGVRERVA